MVEKTSSVNHQMLKTFFPRLNNYFPRREKVSSFLANLIISYWLIIVVCICIMGILSYNYIGNNIKKHTIELNKETLIHFRNQIDNFLLEGINDTSLKILQDCRTNSHLSFYFSNPLEGHVVDVNKIKEYVDSIKSVNTISSKIAIYYKYNNLLVSTDCIRHTLYQEPQYINNDELNYYQAIVDSIDFSNNIYWYFEDNYPFKYLLKDETNQSMIHFIRKIPGKVNNSGVIIISIDENVLRKNIKKSAPSSLDNIIIVDYDGTIISHTHSKYIGKNICDFDFGKNVVTSQGNSGYFLCNASGTQSVVSYTTSAYNSWKYINVTPLAQYNNGIGFLLNTILLTSFLTIFLGLIVSVFSAKKVSSPLVRLVDFCKNVSNIKKPGNSLNTISSIVTDMSDELKLHKLQIEKSYPILKINFIRMLTTNEYLDNQEINDKMELLNISFPYKNFLAVIIILSGTEVNRNYTQLELEYEKLTIVNTIEKQLNMNNSVCLCGQVDDHILAVINTDIKYYELIEILTSQIFANLNNTTKLFRKYIGIGSYVDNIMNVIESYNSASASIEYSYIYPEQTTFRADEKLYKDCSIGIKYKKLVGYLESSLKSKERNKSIKNVDAIINYIKSTSINIDYAKKYLQGLFYQLIKI
ncbi:MAG TPA: cache domain-containing protein [Clostridiales bacterium]|nr:cache domain-containing protein [Clostridiales bacterium]